MSVKKVNTLTNLGSEVVFASALRGTGATSSSDFHQTGARGVRLYLNITATAGTAETLDLKVQIKNPLSGTYQDLTDAVFAQKTATGSDSLTIYPGIGEVATSTINDYLGQTWRVVGTIGGSATPTFTYEVFAEYIL